MSQEGENRAYRTMSSGSVPPETSRVGFLCRTALALLGPPARIPARGDVYVGDARAGPGNRVYEMTVLDQAQWRT